MTRRPDALPAPDRLFALVFATSFAIGGANHARDLVQGGLLPYPSVPLAINAFWSLLCPVDLALAALVWIRRRTAIGLAVPVLLADVGVNSWIAYFSGLHVASFEPLQVQSLFLGFVLAGALFTLPDRGRAPHRSRHAATGGPLPGRFEAPTLDVDA